MRRSSPRPKVWVADDVHEGTVRYDDDQGEFPQNEMTWDEMMADHGDDIIELVRITAGCSHLGMTSAFVNSFRHEINGEAPVTVSFSD